MDTAQWPQEIVVKPIEEMIVTNKERIIKARFPTKQQVINCPRCNSTNTKFCYYNNYSLTQPRYFCKTCRRYWTEGGSLRNIPVGGGSRKNKRSSTSSSSSSSTSSITTTNITRLPDSASQTQSHKINQTPQDLNLTFQSTSQHHHFNHITDFIQEAHHNIENNNNNISVNSTPTDTNTSHLSALELITGLTSRGFNSFMPMSVPDPNGVVYNTSGFPLVQEFKPSLNFSLNGVGSGYSSSVPDQTNGRLSFPFEDLKEVDDDQQNNKEQGEPTGYWTGMLGGGSW